MLNLNDIYFGEFWHLVEPHKFENLDKNSETCSVFLGGVLFGWPSSHGGSISSLLSEPYIVWVQITCN